MMEPTGTSGPQTSGGATSPSEEPETTGRETVWVVLGWHEIDHEHGGGGYWIERQERLTAATRREAERDALTLTDGKPVSVVPARSWDPKAEERPTEIRVVEFDPWAGA